jgi:hypothetical protein
MIPGIADKAKRADFIREMISRDSGSVTDRAKRADFENNMRPIHMQNTGGFDPSSLMSAPQLRQDATMNQANMVSSPYFEANEKAAEKTNPMNAASQEPGKVFLMKFIGKK